MSYFQVLFPPGQDFGFLVYIIYEADEYSVTIEVTEFLGAWEFFIKNDW